ncbi:MAG TPA: ATP-binding cassette domain-containing protein, partial [Blastocatellia bacterium]|nr:ATP-binding cassette domain-containing protein [Blastocatellia bacterium]
EYEQQQQMIAKTEDFIRRNIAGQKTKQAKSRRNMLERLERVDAVRQDHTGHFGLAGVARTGDQVLTVDELAVGYGSNILASGISFLLRRGERLGIIGPPGTGKTTFLKTIIGDIECLKGGAKWGANVDLTYFDQDLAMLDRSVTVIEEIMSVAPRVGEGELRNYLARFLFSGDDAFKPVAALSGGEQSRLALAKLIYSKANVLVLDEPTNHLDIPSREALERALSEYKGTIITVSHDRYFLDRIATEILHFEGGSATYHFGSYSDYYAEHHRAPEVIEESVPKQRAPKSSRSRPDTPRKIKRRSVLEIEGEIHELECDLAKLSEQLSNPAPEWRAEQYAEINNRHEELSSELEKLYQEWEASNATPTEEKK